VLLDGAPIEVQYANDVLINARMPEAVGAAISRLVVVSGGVASEPVEVRRLPEVAVISLDGSRARRWAGLDSCGTAAWRCVVSGTATGGGFCVRFV
jgi:hypothetical protein